LAGEPGGVVDLFSVASPTEAAFWTSVVDASVPLGPPFESAESFSSVVETASPAAPFAVSSNSRCNFAKGRLSLSSSSILAFAIFPSSPAISVSIGGGVTGGAVDGEDAAEVAGIFDLAEGEGDEGRGLSGFGGRKVALISPIPKKSSTYELCPAEISSQPTWDHFDQVWDIAPNI